MEQWPTKPDHVHDCTGPEGRCPCGFQFRVPRYLVSFDVYDNETKTTVTIGNFSTDSLLDAIEALRAAADDLEVGRC